MPKKPEWIKKTLKLKDDHTWTAKPGFKIFVADRGAVRFDFPESWVVQPAEDAIGFYDKKPPDDDCTLKLSVLRLPPDIDWRGLPLAKLVQDMVDHDTRNVLDRQELVEVKRGDLEICWAELRFIDPNECRVAHSRACLCGAEPPAADHLRLLGRRRRALRAGLGRDPADPGTRLEDQGPHPRRAGKVNPRPYLAIARPDHWFKNVFMLAGVLLACFYHPDLPRHAAAWRIAWAVAATCLIASTNYVLNEILDAPTDRHHPTKRARPIPSGAVSLPVAWAEWLALGAAGLAMAHALGRPFFLAGLALLVMGLIYNIPPVRSKDLPYVDVLTESINNPIRLLLGWFAVTAAEFPPVSLLIAYWMVGAYFMATKRFAEYRFLADPRRAGRTAGRSGIIMRRRCWSACSSTRPRSRCSWASSSSATTWN